MRRFSLAVATVLILVAALAFRPNGTTAQGKLPACRVNIVVRGDRREITSNGIPDHPPGQFPNRHNPNAIRPQEHRFRVPLKPKDAATPVSFGLGKFGIAVNGVPFDPGAAEFWNRDPNSGWQYEAKGGAVNLGLDASNAHVQPTGSYHYHGIPVALVARLTGKEAKPVRVGYAADGYPIYGPLGYSDPDDPASDVRLMKSSYRVKQGARPGGPGGRYDGSFVQDWEYVAGSGNLDECNGRTAATPDAPEGEYHYVLTEDFPFIPRKFRGTPDDSFRGPLGGGRGGPPGGPPPGRDGRRPTPPPR